MSTIRAKSGCGFSLVEMLMVVAIIALLAGATGGLYIGSFKGATLRKAARDFELMAKYARMTAIERQQTCSLKLDLANGVFMLVTERQDPATGETGQVILRDAWIKPVEFEGDVKFELAEIGTDDPGRYEAAEASQDERTIIFRPDGTSENAIVQIGNGKAHYTITVAAATGRARTVFGTGGQQTFAAIDLDRQEY